MAAEREQRVPRNWGRAEFFFLGVADDRGFPVAMSQGAYWRTAQLALPNEVPGTILCI